MKPRSVLILALVFTVLIRLTPVIYTGNVFSNDSWILVHVAQYISLNPGSRVFKLYDSLGYHVYYPCSILESIVYSYVTGVNLVFFYKFIGAPVLSTAMFISTYVLARRRGFNPYASVASALAPSLIPSFTLYTSAYLKEFYAHVVFILLVYIASVFKSMSLKHALILAPLLSVALVLSHPLTSIMSIIILLGYIYVNISWFITRREQFKINTSTLVALVYVASVFTAHSFLVAKGFMVASTSDILVFSTYTASFYLAYTLLGSRLTAILALIATLLSSTVLLKLMTTPITPIMALFTAPFVALVFNRRKGSYSSPGFSGLTASVLLTITVAYLYLSTYMVEALSVVHRVLNYVVYALIPVLAGLTERSKRVSTVLLTLLATTSVVVTVLTSMGLNPLLFYWRYTDQDVTTMAFVEQYSTTVVYGDPKYSQASRVVTSIPLGFLRDTCGFKGVFLLSIDNLVYGVPLSPVDFYTLSNTITTCRSSVFTNGKVFTYT